MKELLKEIGIAIIVFIAMYFVSETLKHSHIPPEPTNAYGDS
jgi:hypothetical protein